MEKNINNCKNRDTVQVEVLLLPNINMPKDTNICFGESLSLTVQTEVGDYQWLPTQGVNNPNGIDVVITPNQTTTYYLTVQDTFGCKNKDSIVINLNPLPNILSTKDTLVCDSVLSKIWVSGGEKYTRASTCAGLHDLVIMRRKNPRMRRRRRSVGCLHRARVVFTLFARFQLPAAAALGLAAACQYVLPWRLCVDESLFWSPYGQGRQAGPLCAPHAVRCP